MKLLQKPLSDNRQIKTLLFGVFFILILGQNACKPEENEEEPYQLCISGNTRIIESNVSLNNVTVDFSHARTYINDQNKVTFYLYSRDQFPFVFVLAGWNISLDSNPSHEQKLLMGLEDCDLIICSQSNSLLEGDTVFAEITEDNNIHVFMDAKIINTDGGAGCSTIKNQSFDTAHFVVDILLEQ